eukprot:CAMPEP_0194041924 /NCGR_PEP_ID=MMETSP0009_2-20130614/13739_1 /TAXON_ID=210454 /ORGANISM="Grammatophora oceanica, Strain CCMP 410" /LENGTH=48 /DNA_ID= /DNA_START= /DNA_END= /DNA_ORIENTATION=
MNNLLEHAAVLAGLDDGEKASFLTARYDQPQDLAKDLVEVFGDEFSFA